VCEEYAIARNNTFELVQCEPWRNVIRYKYLFKVKVDSLKVRLVAMDCLQVHGVDYTETFALSSSSPRYASFSHRLP
jgi:hypothetical protein